MYPTKTFWIRSCIQRIIKCEVILNLPPPPLQNPGYAKGDCTHCMALFRCKSVFKRVFSYVKTGKIRCSLPLWPNPGYMFPPSLAKSWVHHCIWGRQFFEPPQGGRIFSYATDRS